ncbi:hypothetical protein J7J84_01285 [bacterium]|nr:hypothetical protein [bacterium]
MPSTTRGLIVPHIDLGRRQSPYPWEHIEVESENVPSSEWLFHNDADNYPPELYRTLTKSYPFVGDRFDQTSTIKPTWHDGTAAPLAVTNIRFLNNRKFREWYDNTLQIDGEWTDLDHAVGYGDIICDVDVGKPLFADFNGDGIVNEGDEAMLRLNIGREVGVDTLRVPVDVNGDGFAGLARDRDGDGYIATSERIYDDAWELVHTTGDWLDLNGDGMNDLDADGNGQWDAIDRFLDEYGGVPWVYRHLDDPFDSTTTAGRDAAKCAPTTGRCTGQVGNSARTASARGSGERVASARGMNIRVPSSTFEDDLFDVGSAAMGGVDVRSLSVPMLILDNEGDGALAMLDADLDGIPDLVPAMLDPDGDGVVTEADAAYLGYYWGETTFEELWIPLPAPS